MSDIKDLTRTNGEVEVPLGYGSMDRDSVAWNPDSGDSVRRDVPRISSNRIPIFKFNPQIFYNFTEPQTQMDYSGVLPNNTGYTYTDRAVTFETEYPQFSKINIGPSYEGRPLYAYRLPKTGSAGSEGSTKHCVMTSIVHANEVDGLDGLFKAMEILATNPAFSNFRDEWTLLWVPVMNPDGYIRYTRNLAEVGPNGKTVNLNRNWNWFWSDFTESDAESKGSSPGSTAEATALLNYFNAVVGSGGRFGACIDFHSTQGVPSRYQSRDRMYHHVTGAPGEGGEIPDCDLTIGLDWHLFQINKAFATKRIHDYNGRDLYIRYYRSSSKPHMHPYWTSQGAFAVAVEEVKVDYTSGDKETVASACNFRMDYALAFAATVTEGNWEYKDSVLVEKATTNILNNADMKDWQDEARVTGDTTPEERPSYYSLGRSSTERITSASGLKHFDGGEAVKLTSDIDISLTEASEFNSIAADGYNSASVVMSSGGIYCIPDSRYNAQSLFPNGLTYHTSTVATAACPTIPVYSGSNTAIDVLGGGTGPFVGATSLITRVDTYITDGATAREYQLENAAGGSGTGFTARSHAGYCDNFLDGPTDANKRMWTFGGQDENDIYLNEIGEWAPNAKTFSVLTSVIPSGIVGACSVYDPITNNCYIFGGNATGGFSNQIYKFDTGGDTLTTLGTQLPSGMAHMAGAYHPDKARIYLYGGEKKDGNTSEEIYNFNTISEELTQIFPTVEDMADYEENENDDTFLWNTKIGRWTAATLAPAGGSPASLVLVGGRNTDSATPVDAVLDTIYVHDLTDDVIGTLALYSYGYLRYSTMIPSGGNGEQFSYSVFAKSTVNNDYGYFRATARVNDDDGPTPGTAIRFVRNFYTIPPKTHYRWYHARVDLREGNQVDQENGIRAYLRLYKDNQHLFLDGIHIQAGSMITSSYQHPDHPRVDETFTFTDAVNPDNFKIRFDWMATTSFVDIEEDLEIARVSVDGNDYISLTAIAGERYQRQYNTYNIHGPHDPKFELRKYVGGVLKATASVVCYWGYDLRETSVERQDDTMRFTIEHLANDNLTLKIKRYGFEGRDKIHPGSDAWTSNSASIAYNGVGYYSSPTIIEKTSLPNGRKVPFARRGLASRIRDLSRGQTLVGERDPSNGDQIGPTAFSIGDNFNRDDSSSLGSDWDNVGTPYYRERGGWTLLNNLAQCAGSGFQRWDRYPRHADIVIKADARVDYDGNRVGILARWDDNLRRTGYPASGVTGYSAELQQTGASAANLRIMRWDNGRDTQLSSQALSSYTETEVLPLSIETSGIRLVASITGRATTTVDDSSYMRPRRVGIYGLSDSNNVKIDNFEVAPNFPSGVL